MIEPTLTAEANRVHKIKFQFTGSAKEYFGIWIVNTLLTLLTLGIYSAWAKVRNKKYFYNNTQLNKASFDFLAKPSAILKGRAIAVVVFAAYVAIVNYFPVMELPLTLLFMAVLPWLVVRSLIFNLRNTSHRNIRFNLRKNYREAIWVFFGLGILVPLTLGLILPYAVYRQFRFVAEHSEYGQGQFSYTGRATDFYLAYLKVAVIMLLGLVAVVAIGAAAVYAYPPLMEALPLLLNPEQLKAEGNEAMAMALVGLLAAAAVIFYVVALGVYFYLQGLLFNLTWNHVMLDGNRFRSRLRPGRLAGIHFSNMLATMASLGLLYPWAQVRLMRYKVQNLSFYAKGDVSRFIARAQSKDSAVGEEIADIFDVDIAI